MTFPTNWARKCAITINHSQVAGSGTHAAFPVCLTLANLPSEMLDGDGLYPAQMGGGDIRFTSDSAGTQKLPCHVLEFITNNTPASAQALIYVAVTVSALADTTIYVWYNTASRIEQPKYNANPDADGFQGSDYVWANYQTVIAMGGLHGLCNLKQANSSKNLGRYGSFQPKTYIVGERASGLDYVAWPSIVKAGNRLYCSASATPIHAVNTQGSVCIYYSDDLGKTWAEDAGLYIATDGSHDYRTGRLFLQSDGTLWVTYSKTNAADTTRVVMYRKSSAPYTSWGAETTLTTQTRVNEAGRPIELASGRIVVPCYDIVAGLAAPFVRWSDDNGSTWTTDYLTSDGNAPGTYTDRTEFSIAEDPATPGNLVAILRRDALTNLYRLTSTTSGETWSTDVANIALDAGSWPDMPEISYCQDGDLLMAYAKDRPAPEYLIRRSTDHGVTWAADYAILWDNSGGSAGEPGGLTGAGGYCSFVELYKGTFAAVYYHDNATADVAKVWCTHFTKVEDGQLNYWTDTSWATPGQVKSGIELSDADLSVGNTNVDYFNNVHNGGAFTISGWSKFNQTADEVFIFMGSSVTNIDRGFFFGYENRVSQGSPDSLKLFKADGVSTTINSVTSAISCNTSPHRFGVFCDALGTPTFIKDATTYSGDVAITATAGNATQEMRFGAASYTTSDLAVARLDGWMEMWGFSTTNLGANYEVTRYNSESAPGTFASVGTPGASTGTSSATLIFVKANDAYEAATVTVKVGGSYQPATLTVKVAGSYS